MTMELAVDIMRNLLQTGLILSIPILGTALVVGLVVSFIQSITSLQEQTLTFVPKLVCVSLAIVISANFILKTMTEFCISMFNLMPTMAQ
ncbi:MAG TPA: flagellar biosynthetic protein FliQ [Opitutae bacterium]|jgi:flagellar biosynthetic protein FliQ|nr:flagellar biosynthetic protein FliQ [Puniceicoccaceae bacterium]OUU57979.1 MAG: flagellar biosynthetic protein FliQ [Verrucomicrobia bacterium TMED60]HAU59213.1 flagellar biosynthetic protein FliQ [Opitutae bacterium]HCY58086.1 flagellar biosynthetic protein FliQ [Opitutae bacterium]|tara:strand:+ start:25714 stop:25983 length:270 start_codon:yes stop_codon:yes gene_type:complete